MMLPKYVLIIPLSALLYNVVLTIFRFSTWEITDLKTSGLNTFLFCLLFVATYTLSNFDQTTTNIFQIILSILSIVLARKDYTDNVVGVKPQPVNLDGKVFVITGSNAGIGFETAKQIAKFNGTVVLACRSVDKANQAKNLILAETKCAASKVIVIKLDLCGFDSVRKFVKEFKSLGLPLHTLINNAGVMIQERMLTQDGFEMVFTANHLSHFLLTNLLLPDLEKTSGRIVTVSSSTHHLVKGINLDDVMSVNNYELFQTYAQSKLANILFTKELQKRLRGSGSKIKCFSLHPGCVRTEVTRNMSAFMQIGNRLAAPIMCTLQKTPEQGAYCSVYVSTSPELQDLRGGEYFLNSEVAQVSEAASNEATATVLWAVSERLTGLTSLTR